LKLSNLNNPILLESYSIQVDQNYKNTFTLLNFNKCLDNNYSIFFIDIFNHIQKFNLKIIEQMPNNNNIKKININKNKENSIDLKHQIIKTKSNIILNNQNNNNNQRTKSNNKKFITFNKHINKNSFNSENLKSTSVIEKKKQNSFVELNKNKEKFINFSFI